MISKSQLKITLSQLDGFKQGKTELEQYMTMPEVAADMIYFAHLSGDIAGKQILDLGCGTGILSIGCSLMSGQVIGIDKDSSAIKVGRKNIKKAEEISDKNLTVNLKVKDIRDFQKEVDTVIMNPPFGIRSRKNKNLLFLRKACRLGQNLYALLHSSEEKKEKTRKFIKDFLHKQSAEVKGIKSFACQVKEKGKEKKIGLDMYHIVVNNGS